MMLEILQAMFPVTRAAKADSIQLFSADLDGTLLGEPAENRRFRAAWAAFPQTVKPLLVYNTARHTADVRALIGDGTLAAPDYLIAGLGTEISSAPHWAPFPGYKASIRAGWNTTAAREILANEPGITPQPAQYQTPEKLSYYARRIDLESLASRLSKAGIEARLVHSSGRFLDVLPARAGKGAALAWLCARLGIDGGNVLVAGDTANDADMFQLRGVRGIIVGDTGELDEFAAHPAHFRATKAGPDGVIEGLAHFSNGAGKFGNESHCARYGVAK